MIKDLKINYNELSDGLIYGFKLEQEPPIFETKIEILIQCINWMEDGFDLIKIIFSKVIEHRFVQKENHCSTVIRTALIKEENEVITVDFFPNMSDTDDLIENSESDLIIKCKKIEYEFIRKLWSGSESSG